MTSSILSTVRSAVLNGVFNGTRSMPKRMSVIFIELLTDALNAVDVIDDRLAFADEQWCERCDGHAIQAHTHGPVPIAIADASRIVNDIRHTIVVADHHHDVTGNIDEITNSQLLERFE